MRRFLARAAVIFVIPLIFFAFLFMLACGGLGAPLEIIFYLLAGWIFFILRVVKEVHVSPVGLTTAIVALAAFAVGLHWFLRWLYAHTGGDSIGEQHAQTVAQSASRSWSRRWTAQIVVLIAVMFAAGISMIGATHQLAWLITTQERLFFSSGREVVRRNASTNHLKQIGIALSMYEESHGNAGPPAATMDAHGRALHSWLTMTLPYAEGMAIYQKIDLSKPWNAPENAPQFKQVLDQYLNPSVRQETKTDADGFGLSHYAANAWVFKGARPPAASDFTDGRSSTIVAGEAAGNFQAWGRPVPGRSPRLGISKSPDGFGGNRTGVTMFLCADGSVRAIADEIDPQVFESLCTPAGGEVVEWP